MIIYASLKLSQAITRNNDNLWSIEPLKTKFNEIWNIMRWFSSKKMLGGHHILASMCKVHVIYILSQCQETSHCTCVYTCQNFILTSGYFEDTCLVCFHGASLTTHRGWTKWLSCGRGHCFSVEMKICLNFFPEDAIDNKWSLDPSMSWSRTDKLLPGRDRPHI